MDLESLEFPAFVKSLPQVDLPFQGVQAWLLQADRGQVVFVEADERVAVPEHSHGDQWGIVVDGEIDLLVGHQVQTYKRGDSYYIPAGTPHAVRLFKGSRAVDYFADPNRYRPRPST